jgi:hypothetical protein
MAITLDGTNGINSSGVIVAPDGSASAPAITNDGDTNTGIFFPAADTIAFAEGGAEAMRIDSSANLQFNSGYGSVATAYGCRAWVNFNGTNTVAIRASGNVSSITDNGTGAYTVNFTTALPDANYAVNATGDSTGARIASVDNAAGVPTTSAVRVGFLTTGGGAGDPTYAMVSVFR